MLVKKMSAAALAGALLTASLPAMSMAAEKPMQVEVNGKSTILTDAQLSWDPETNSVKVTSTDGVELKLKAEKPKVEAAGTVKDWYGFKVVTDSDSKLLIDKGSYEEYKTSYLFSFLITFGKVGEDHPKQLEEVESILRQKVESSTVGKVMKVC